MYFHRRIATNRQTMGFLCCERRVSRGAHRLEITWEWHVTNVLAGKDWRISINSVCISYWYIVIYCVFISLPNNGIRVLRSIVHQTKGLLFSSSHQQRDPNVSCRDPKRFQQHWVAELDSGLSWLKRKKVRPKHHCNEKTLIRGWFVFCLLRGPNTFCK